MKISKILSMTSIIHCSSMPCAERRRIPKDIFISARATFVSKLGPCVIPAFQWHARCFCLIQHLFCITINTRGQSHAGLSHHESSFSIHTDVPQACALKLWALQTSVLTTNDTTPQALPSSRPSPCDNSVASQEETDRGLRMPDNRHLSYAGTANCPDDIHTDTRYTERRCA